MKQGFLLGDQPSPAAEGASTSRGSSAAGADPQQSSPEAAAAAAAAPPRPPPTPEQAAVALEQCLELLKGPSDERRFVGLLLVTKLLPAGDDDTIRRVHDAVGPTFLSRLLLPLRTSGAQPPASLEAAQKAVAGAGLGLAVLSGFARVPDLAAGEDVLQKLPLLLNVARTGGVAPLLAAAAARAAAGSAAAAALAAQLEPGAMSDPAAEAAAVLDALETAVAAARSGEEGRAVASDSGALGAAAAALQRCPPAQTQQLSLALQLAAAVLGDEQQRAELLAGETTVVLDQLLPALARVFALPAAQLAATQQQPAEELQRRLLAVQLEALHVLLLLLPLPYATAERLEAERLAAGAPGAAAWLAQLRQGLGLLLRGRVSAVQRHSALQLAAAVVDLAGPDWLLGGGCVDDGGPSSKHSRGSGSSSGSGRPGGAKEAEAFFQLAVEVAKVETSVLLHDALAPHAPVPLASAPGAAAGEWRPPAPRAPHRGAASSEEGGSEAGDGLHEAGAELAADLAGDAELAGDADMEPLLRVLHSEEDRRQLEAQLEAEQRQAEAAAAQRPQPGDHMRAVDAVELPTDMRWEGPSEAAGARAARVLPSCFALLEGCIEALAADTQRAEALTDAAGPLPSSDRPLLSDAVAQRALFSLQEAVEVVLQFLEQTAWEGEEEQEGAGGQGAAAAARQPMQLAAARVLARFCSEVPEAFGGRLRPLLPALLALRADGGGGGLAGEVEAEPQPAEGAAFLLPLLLQVTDPGYASGSSEHQHAEQQAWLEALSEPAALRPLLRYALQCAAACPLAVATAAGKAADEALLYACQLLLNVAVGGEPGGRSRRGTGAEQQHEVRRQLAAAPEVLQLLQGVLALARQRPLAPAGGGSPDAVVHAARLRSALAALAAVVANSVAAGTDASSPAAAEQREQQREQQQQPALGPISGPQMSELSAQLLAALQAATALTCSEGHLRQLGLAPAALLGFPAGAASAGQAAAWLDGARAAVAADEALQLELLRCLDVGAAEAAAPMRCYPPFAAAAGSHPFIAAQLAAAAAMAGVADESPPGLALLLAAVTDLP